MAVEQAIEITVQDLDGMRRTDAAHIILDVRNPPEIEICAIAGSTNIPMQDVPANLDQLPGEGMLVVICHSGRRSLSVTTWLRENGFANAVNLRGGIDSWAREIDDTMAVY
jgi:rhodanese-related sulfurtransferase